MKLLFILFLIAIITTIVYFVSFKLTGKNKKQKKGPTNSKPYVISLVVAAILIVFVAHGMYQAAVAPDTQCTTVHTPTSNQPADLSSAMDYFMQANYDYDIGSCQKAIDDYTKSIELNPNFPQAYNNRAYTYMRLHNYKDALPDLDKAIELKPEYVQALMNRADIHNYYFMINRQAAITDYEKVISIKGSEGTSVCGHLFLAQHDGWNLGTFLALPSQIIGSCN